MLLGSVRYDSTGLPDFRGDRRLTMFPGRATQLRKVPIRRVQEASCQDGRAESIKGRCQEQLDDFTSGGRTDGLYIYN